MNDQPQLPGDEAPGSQNTPAGYTHLDIIHLENLWTTREHDLRPRNAPAHDPLMVAVEAKRASEDKMGAWNQLVQTVNAILEPILASDEATRDAKLRKLYSQIADPGLLDYVKGRAHAEQPPKPQL